MAVTKYNRGFVSYDEGAYAVALASFQSAYEVCPYPVFLQASSVCEAKLGRYQDAVVSARLAQRLNDERGDSVGGLSPKELQQSRAHVLAWRQTLQARDVAQKMASRSITLVSMGEKEAISPPLSPPPPRARQAGWVMLSVGGTSLATSGALSVLLQSRIARAQEDASGGSTPQFNESLAAAKRTQLAARLALLSGVALLGAGALTLQLSDSPSPTRAVRLRGGHKGHVLEWIVRF